MDLETDRRCLVQLPPHRWGPARPLPAAALPVGCLQRLDALQSNRDCLCVLVGASVGLLEACLQQLSAELASAKRLLGLRCPM